MATVLQVSPGSDFPGISEHVSGSAALSLSFVGRYELSKLTLGSVGRLALLVSFPSSLLPRICIGNSARGCWRCW